MNRSNFTSAAVALTTWAWIACIPLALATDSRCPVGMHSPDGNSCVPGESMHDETEAIINRPYQPMTFRTIEWSSIAMDTDKLLVTDQEMKFIGVSRGKKDMREAEKAALAMCRSDGSRNCKVIETVVNSFLAISISVKSNTLEYVFSADMQLAIEQSLGKCNEHSIECKAAYADCQMQ